jgi:hypothetical protein
VFPGGPLVERIDHGRVRAAALRGNVARHGAELCLRAAGKKNLRVAASVDHRSLTFEQHFLLL